MSKIKKETKFVLELTEDEMKSLTWIAHFFNTDGVYFPPDERRDRCYKITGFIGQNHVRVDYGKAIDRFNRA